MRLLLIGLLAALLAAAVIASQPPARRRRWLLGLLATSGLLLLLWLAASGRLHWLAALIASLLPFARRLLPLLRYVPLLRNLLGRYRDQRRATGNSGRRSEVATDWLRMHLDHDSGRMSGQVLQGRFAGRELERLSLDQLRELMAELAGADPESADLLQAYLEREHGESWDASGAADADEARQSEADSASLSDHDEALRILGLAPGAGEAEIIAAHRRLMQKLHPDRGGSDYLAAKVNAAKRLLLDELQRS